VLGAFDDGDPLAEIGGLRTGFFSSRAAPDHDQIEIFATRHTNLPLQTTARIFEARLSGLSG
jgi:hypothetical protein